MNYSKPELTLVGNAEVVIQGNKLQTGMDNVGSSQPFNMAAYDLDD